MGRSLRVGEQRASALRLAWRFASHAFIVPKRTTFAKGPSFCGTCPRSRFLADGLTEETISQLGQLNPEELGVIARTSVMGYKHKDERLDQIGRDLSVHMYWKTAFAKAETTFSLPLSSFR